MKKFGSRLLSIFIVGIVGISAGIIFNITYFVFCILFFVIYIIIVVLIISMVSEKFGGVIEKSIMRDKYINGEIFTLILLIVAGVIGGVMIYRSHIIQYTSHQIAQRTSTHIKFEQGKLPCISIGEPCR